MKIGILITSISNFGQKGFYNAQEIGLAKSMAKICETVEVYKLVPIAQEKKTEKICENAVLYLIPSKNSGINGAMNVDELNQSLAALIHFSDTQLLFLRCITGAKKTVFSMSHILVLWRATVPAD